ncbi:MAG: hypothetical protein HC882_08270 [Acidobacteria bacterium]|nr:hypothetical protein [Acidobacteriota bacterium]
MATRLSTQAANDVADGGLDTLFNGAFLDVYTGAQPADPNAAPTGTLLGTIDLSADWLTTAVNGVKSKNGTWSGLAIANGTAGWARFRRGSDSGGLSTVDTRIDVAVGAEIIFDNPIVSIAQELVVTAYTFTLPRGV